MTMDFVAERLGHANFADLQEIDLPHCDLRTIDVGNGEVFRNLRSINLEHNNLTSFGGLIHLVNLKVLCLNYNKIECVFPKRKTTSPNSKKGPPVAHSSDDVTSPQSFTPVLEKLEVLHLGYNGISNLKALQLSRIPNIKGLFLQGNEISKVEGIQGLQELRELVLDQNKIKTLSEMSFIGQRRLQELHMEDNRLRDLSNFQPLLNLQRLYLGMNKIQELSELHKLERMTNLFEISLISNPITRRLMHRPILVYRQPNILCIDGIPVTNDERTKAEVYLMDHQLASVVNTDGAESNLPNLQTKPQAPLKVTTVQLSTSMENGWSIGHKFGQVEYVESLTPQARYNDRNDPRAKLRASNSYPPQNIPSSYDVTRHGRHQPPTSSSIHLAKPQGQLPNGGSYVLRGNSNSNFPQPPKPK
ncbi:leucine-rich repeat-containing 9-like [Paramuricea clavata]|uniref:Leucine-rich repeat-containing 9-like n=1 Tax=Paramuricea clavata TaxID=317549 RepID=A0A7D9IND0_PARCT|nr:leucine-rich repeat-containing 9-like [Paramuricea clavata]